MKSNDLSTTFQINNPIKYIMYMQPEIGQDAMINKSMSDDQSNRSQILNTMQTDT